MKCLRVHFDQNCMNAKGEDLELQRIQRLHDSGHIELVANVRNWLELGRPDNDGPHQRKMRARLNQFDETPEGFRLDISPMDLASMDLGIETLPPARVWSVIFPGTPMPEAKHPLDSGQNSIHDVMHIVNAHDNCVDVFLTREKRLLAAYERLRTELGLYPSIESPSNLLHRIAGA